MTPIESDGPPHGIAGRPELDAESAAGVLARGFGLTGTLSVLPSDRDQNFLVRTEKGARFVLKIFNVDTPLDLVRSEVRVLDTAAEAGLPVPVPVASLSGEAVSEAIVDGNRYRLRVITFLEGKPLAEFRPRSPALLFELGTILGRLDRVMADLDLPGTKRDFLWDPAHAGETMAARIAAVGDPIRRELLGRVCELLYRSLPGDPETLPRQVIHGDANDYNVLVRVDETGKPGLSGLLDFGDMSSTWRICEPAIACAYAMLDKADPVAAACAVVSAYHAANPLTEPELATLYPLILGRLGISACMSAHQKQLEPDNTYLTISEGPVWRLLEKLNAVHPRLVHYRFRAACGLEPCPSAPAVRRWIGAHRDRLKPVVDGDASRAVVFDVSVGSLDWPPEVLMHPRENPIQDAAAFIPAGGVGIGRYDEARLVYTGSQFAADGGERRTVHIGFDLFQAPGMPVYAPLDGQVVSVRNNDLPGDYGPTVMLRHEVEDAPVFHTLFGHLDGRCLQALKEGSFVRGGDQIAEIGSPPENGGWVPHLHFQILVDPLDAEGDFPGVAAPSQRDVFKSLCPDPNLICGFPDHLFPGPSSSHTELLAARRRWIGPSLSLSYRKPLRIVRGHMQHLFDVDGRVYLDGVNNVAHVGHEHPRVVEAAQRQMRTLNTNTRYLHDLLPAYAKRLAATLPDPLSVVYLVNSGSEANDLALRIARARTGARHTIVVDNAYHGNLSSVIDLSPYKYARRGGSGAPPTTHAVPMPDRYRGPHREEDSGATYAGYVRKVCERLAEEDVRPVFLAESAMSCGGQVFFPDGYLRAAYAHVREAGGVCIADEVQVGLGRFGDVFWGFEAQDVVPDIVTIGKPIGNGHPMGAVVTTPELAATFANGMEYFNTFGGNPVSCAVGLAVLDVLESERLVENAKKVGARLLNALESLTAHHSVLGNVRGRGLFLGIELVRDRRSLEPADREAAYVVNRLAERGFLLSTDGPLENVIKIKPPLVFTAEDADRLVEALDDTLGDDPVRFRQVPTADL